MFICVSPNPAIDKRLVLPALVPGRVLRASSAHGFPGGKSAHVAMVLRTLGEVPHWIAPCGGTTGTELAEELSKLSIQVTAVRIGQPTRTNLEIVEQEGRVTEILEPGAALAESEWNAFFDACKKLFAQGGKGALAIFSGSLPAGAPPDVYAHLIAIAQENGCRTLLDTSGERLRLALAARPDFVKPNREEACGLLGSPISSLDDAAAAIQKLFRLGARSVALTLGMEGLLFSPAEGAPIYFAAPPPLQPRTTVGCGDSALAGFAHAMACDASPEDTLSLAAACAAANCLADSPGAARLEDVQEFQPQIVVKTLRPGP